MVGTGGEGPDLVGRVALVTGASRGIGRAIALALAEAGMDLALAARGQAGLDAVAGEVRTRGRRCVAVATDVGVPAAVDRLVGQTLAELGRVKVLFPEGVATAVPYLLRQSRQAWTSEMTLWPFRELPA